MLGLVHRNFRERMDELVAAKIEPFARELEGTCVFPEKAHREFAREGLYTLAAPKEFGGGGADALTLSLMVESIARVSPSAALLVFPTNAVLRTIALTGTPDQQERFFGELNGGGKCLAFCLTEPDHGSEAFSLTTSAQANGSNYIVQGSKVFVTLGPHAEYYLTFVRTGPAPKAGGISALLIPRRAPGVNFGPPEKKMGLHGSITAQMFLDEAKVPKDNRLWPEGQGWQVLSQVCNPMRVWGAGSLALGCAQGMFDLALEHAQTAQDGGRPLMAQQAMGFALADMKMKIEACRSLIRRTCAMLDASGLHDNAANGGAPLSKELENFVSMSKCLAADTAMQVGDLASQVLGRDMARQDSLAAMLYCAAKAVQIFDGSNQIQRLIVARNLPHTG